MEKFGPTSQLGIGMKKKTYAHDKFGLWVDARSVTDVTVVGSGMLLENGMDVVNIEIEKEAGTGTLNCYVYQITDAQINILNGNLDSVVY